MPAIKIDKFGGELPAWDPKLLPDGQSQRSINGYMFTGRLEGWRTPTLLRALTNPNANYVYRIPQTTFDQFGNAIFSPAIAGPSTWIEATDPDTTVVRSQVVNDQFQRYYTASPTQGIPNYNTLQRIQAGAPFFGLGIPQPATAPFITVNGGGSLSTIGPNTSVGGGVTVNANVIYLIPIVPSGASIVNSISFMPLATNANVHVQAVVYADAAVGGQAATTPGALLGSSLIGTGITATTLVTLPFSNPVGLNTATPYWIGIMMDTAETIAAGDGVNASAYFLNTFSNGPPSTAPGLTATGQADLQMYANVTTSGVLETRSYVYTYVSAYGEEGPPSNPTVLTGFSNATWTVTPNFPPGNYLGGSGLGNIAVLRIYRTVVSSTGIATYFQLQDIAVGSNDLDAVAFVASDPLGCIPYTPVFVDTVPDSTVALNLPLSSTSYFSPPSNLQGIVTMPNGMYAGWVGNSVYFCQPYLPHAWPPGNVYTVDAPVVGMAVTGGALVVVTGGAPWTFTGTNPAAGGMSQVRGSHVEPCAERGSIIGTDLGVFYKTINGLIQVPNNGQMANYTETWITRDRWNAETPASGTRAIPLLGSYFAFGAASQIGFTVELDVDGASFTIWPQPGGHRIGFNELVGPNAFNVTNISLDFWTGIGLLIQNGQVYYYDFTNPTPVMQTYDWTSKVYQQNTKRSFEAFKVWFTNPNGLPPPGMRNTTPPTDPSWQSLPPGAWLYVLIYADIEDGTGDGTMQIVSAREVQRSGELLRTLSGFKADNWQVRFIGRVPVSNMQFATSAKELANV